MCQPSIKLKKGSTSALCINSAPMMTIHCFVCTIISCHVGLSNHLPLDMTFIFTSRSKAAIYLFGAGLSYLMGTLFAILVQKVAVSLVAKRGKALCHINCRFPILSMLQKAKNIVCSNLRVISNPIDIPQIFGGLTS